MEKKEQRKRKKRKGRRDVFRVWNEKVLRIGEESDLGGEICSKWNGISSLLKIGGRMLRYGLCPIFINDKMKKYQLDTNWKVWNCKNDVVGKSEFV